MSDSVLLKSVKCVLDFGGGSTCQIICTTEDADLRENTIVSVYDSADNGRLVECDVEYTANVITISANDTSDTLYAVLHTNRDYMFEGVYEDIDASDSESDVIRYDEILIAVGEGC
jgi:hypothetical protein